MQNELQSRWSAKLRNALPMMALAALGLVAWSGPKSAVAGPPIGINIQGVQDYNGDLLFADAMRESRDWRLADGSTEAPVDSLGWPTSDANVYVWAGAPNNVSGTYALSFTGQASIVANGSITNQVYNSGTNTTTATLTMTNTDLNIAFNNSKRTAGSATNTGVTNIKLMRPTTVGGSTTYPTSTVFTPALKAIVAKFSTVRFMDYLGTNGTIAKVWSDRVPPNYASQSVYKPGYGWQGAGGSWEYAIQFANETNKDMWVNIPEAANDTYVSNIALMIKYGSDGVNPYSTTQASPIYAPLNAGLKVYVEYSNELWNSGSAFAQFGMNVADATAEVNAGGSPLNWDGDTNTAYWGARRSAKRTMEISNIFRNVFGSSAMMTTIRPVLESQQGYTGFWLMEQAHMLQDYYNSSAHVTTPRPPSYYIYGGGGSAYYGPDNNSDTLTISNIWTSLGFVPATFAADEQSDSDYALGLYGKRLAYEGGASMDNVGHSEAVKAQAWGDARMTGIETANQTAWNQIGGDLLMYFNTVGDYQFAFTHDVNILNTPKLNGIDQINTSTPAVGNYGVAVPATIPAGNFLAPPTWFTIDPNNMDAAGYSTYTIYTATNSSATAYTIGLSAGSSSAGNQADVYLDGALVGTIAIPNNGKVYVNTPTVTSATIPAGTHGILIKAKTGTFGFGSVIVTTGAPAAPAPPTGLTATAGNAQVALSWTASAGATAYDVKRSTTSGSGYVTVSSPTTTSFTNTGLTNGTTYFFVVDAKNASGTSANSSQVSATPAAGGSGSLSGSSTTSTTAVNLTTEGTTDWIHFGNGAVPGIDRMSSGGSLISAYTVVGTGGANSYGNDPRPVSWTNGTPNTSGTNNLGGVYIAGVNNGFSITAPADTTQRTLVVHVGGWSSTGTVTAHLSDGSAADFNNTAAGNLSAQYDVNYTLIYKAGSAGKTLTVTWKMASGTGNVTINAAALVVNAGSAPAAPTGLTATPSNAQVALSWTASSGATAYDVKRSTTSGSGYVTVSSPTTTSFTNTGLTNGTTYFFVVDAKNASGTSANSAQVSATPFATITTGLKGWWKLDETSGTTASDSSGNSVNGTVTAGTWVAGKFANALSFNGTSSLVDVGDPAALNFAGQITVSAWVKPTAVASESIIMGHGWDGSTTPWWLSLTDATHIRLGHSGVQLDATASASLLGAWHLVTGVYDGTAYRVYLDGTQIATVNSALAPGTGTNTIRIGAINETNQKFFNGSIDDARIYNRALSAAEITSIFNGNG